jgi:hypothetical protein
MQHPVCGKVVVDGFVLRASVIPYRDRIGLPIKSAAKFRRRDMTIKKSQYGLTLLSTQLQNARGEQ